MVKLKCEGLLNDTGKEYQKISEAFEAFRSGKITGKELNQITQNILNNVDSMIESYQKNNMID